jgi:hypothetical protein
MKKILLAFTSLFTSPIKEKKEKKEKKKTVNIINVTNDPGTAFTVCEVEPGDKDLRTALGITFERAALLQKECKHAIHSTSDVCKAIHKMAPHMKHANEFFYCSYILAAQQMESRHAMMAIAALTGLGGSSQDRPDKTE